MLMVSIHDVAPRFLPVVQRMREALDTWGAGAVTLLVVPRFHGEDDLRSAGDTVRWLRERARAGDEIALHGYTHIERGPLRGVATRLRGALLSAGEAEYLSLTAEERDRYLRQGRDLLQDTLGCAVRGFVAPAWLEPRGLASELAALGFGWHETGLYVESLGASGTRMHAPVIGFATRTLARRLAAVAWARALTPLLDGYARLARRAGRAVPVRVALHPADATSEQVMACAESVIRDLARHHPSLSVADALGSARAMA